MSKKSIAIELSKEKVMNRCLRRRTSKMECACRHNLMSCEELQGFLMRYMDGLLNKENNIKNTGGIMFNESK